MTEQQPSVHDVGSLIDATPERQLTPHNVPFFTSDENQKPVSVEEFFRDNQDVVQVTRDLIAEAKSFVPPTADEDMNGEEYKLRVIGEIKKRIQWRGDYIQGTDQLFNHLEDKDLEHTDLILAALEAQENEIKKSLGVKNVPDTVTMKRLVQSQAEAALIASTAPQIEIQQVEDESDAEQERIDESEALREIDAAPIPEIDPSSETPKPPLQTHFSFAVVAIPDRSVQDRRRAAAHSFNNDVTRRAGRDRVVDAVSNTVSRIPIPGVNRVAGRVTRGVGTAIAHPVRTIWQNNLARDVFEQEHVRFTTALENTIKEHTDSSVPIAITEELLDIALRHAREAREHLSGGRRTWNRLSDSVKAVTGVAQTSEQELARDWLDRQLRLPSEQRNRELQRVIAQTYDEQTALAERFATPVPQGMDIDRANVAGSIIRPELNESRIMLETGSAAAEQTNRKLKELIKNYSTGRVPDTESLVHQINRFIEAELPRSLSPAERRLFHSPEVANNIILLAEEIKKDWARYSTEQDEAGLTAWDKIQFDIYIGRAEWRGPRGPVERGWLTNWLTRNLAENPTVLNKTTGGAYALLKDAGLTTVAYGGAWLTSTVSAAGRTGARLAGGFASVFGLAGLRRSGIDLAHTGMRGIEGGTVHDVTLRSFESAYGRRFDNPEIQRVLVEQTQAEDMTRNILRESINIQTDQDAIRLLTVLADARAKLHLTDLSDTRELLYKTQNYIKYTEGHDNQESLELRRAIHNGVLAIEAYASTHDVFLARYGGRVFSGMPTEYYHRGRRQRPPVEDMGMLEKFTLIREAQLRYSSTDERRMRRWLERTMRLSRSEVDDMMRNIHPYFVEQVTRENSLRRKEACIQRLRAVQMAETMIDSAAATGVMIPVVAAAGELPDMARHTIHGVSTRGLSGIGEYVNHWHEVLQGEAAPETSIQRAVLAAREWWNRPQVAVPVEQAPIPGGGHDVVVSGTRVELDPITHKYDMIALGPDGKPILDAHGKPVLLIDNATVDPVTGKVSADYINPALMIHEVPPTEALTGNAAVEHWLKLSTKVDHIKWWVHNPQIEQHLYDSSTENAAGSRVIEFRLSNVGIAHQGSESIDVGQLVKDNKIAFALTLPGHLHEPIIIDASSGAVHNGVLRLDPDDYSHFVRVGAEQRAIGDIARDLIKQEELKQLPAGNLGTEVFGRQQVLHLTDSLQKAGHIQVVYIEEQNGKIIEHSFSTIRACGQVEVGGAQAGLPNIVLPNGMTIHVDNAAEAPPAASLLLGGVAPLQRLVGRLSDLALHAVPFGARTNLDRSRSAEAPRSERQHRNLVQEIIETRRAYAEAMEKVERNINSKENLREVSRLRAQLALMQDQLRRSTFGQQLERHPAGPPLSLPLSESGDMPSPRPRRPDPNAGISDDELRESIRRAGLRPRSRSPEGPIRLSRDMQTAIIERYNQLLPDGERRLDPQSIISEYNTIIAPQIRKLINEGTRRDSYEQLRDLASTLSDVMWTSNRIILADRQHREVARMIIGRIVAGELTLADLPEEQLQGLKDLSQTTRNDVPPWGEQPPRTEAKPKEIPLHPDAQWFSSLPELTIQGDLIPSAEGHIAGAEILSIDNQPIPFEIVKLDEGLMGVRAMSRNAPALEVFTDNLGFDTLLTSRPGSVIGYMPIEVSYALIENDVYEIKGSKLVRTDEQIAANIRERADKIRI